jgi:hypothetical protein
VNDALVASESENAPFSELSSPHNPVECVDASDVKTNHLECILKVGELTERSMRHVHQPLSELAMVCVLVYALLIFS